MLVILDSNYDSEREDGRSVDNIFIVESTIGCTY